MPAPWLTLNSPDKRRTRGVCCGAESSHPWAQRPTSLATPAGSLPSPYPDGTALPCFWRAGTPPPESHRGRAPFHPQPGLSQLLEFPCKGDQPEKPPEHSHLPLPPGTGGNGVPGPHTLCAPDPTAREARLFAPRAGVTARQARVKSRPTGAPSVPETTSSPIPRDPPLFWPDGVGRARGLLLPWLGDIGVTQGRTTPECPHPSPGESICNLGGTLSFRETPACGAGAGSEGGRGPQQGWCAAPQNSALGGPSQTPCLEQPGSGCKLPGQSGGPACTSQ